MIAVVEVGVALERPPKEDKVFRAVVVADDDTEAQLIAAQMAAATYPVVMPVRTEVVKWLEV